MKQYYHLHIFFSLRFLVNYSDDILMHEIFMSWKILFVFAFGYVFVIVKVFIFLIVLKFLFVFIQEIVHVFLSLACMWLYLWFYKEVALEILSVNIDFV